MFFIKLRKPFLWAIFCTAYYNCHWSSFMFLSALLLCRGTSYHHLSLPLLSLSSTTHFYSNSDINLRTYDYDFTTIWITHSTQHQDLLHHWSKFIALKLFSMHTFNLVMHRNDFNSMRISGCAPSQHLLIHLNPFYMNSYFSCSWNERIHIFLSFYEVIFFWCSISFIQRVKNLAI